MINRLPSLIGRKQQEENRVIDVATIASETGVSRQTIYNWLNGDVTMYSAGTIEALCRYFQCGVGDLLEYVEKQ